jgi:hypothetical protein
MYVFVLAMERLFRAVSDSANPRSALVAVDG